MYVFCAYVCVYAFVYVLCVRMCVAYVPVNAYVSFFKPRISRPVIQEELIITGDVVTGVTLVSYVT